jgi:hypothetical protein
LNTTVILGGCDMIDFQEQFSGFKLDENLRAQFHNFETSWNTKKTPTKPYGIITVINNNTETPKSELKGDDNAQLA